MDSSCGVSKEEEEFFLQAKSLSLNTFPKSKPNDLCAENLYRSISFIPKKFCPKPRPQKAIISPSPMVLGTKPRMLLHKLSLSTNKKNFPISCEECSSDCDSETSSGNNITNEGNATTIASMRKNLMLIKSQSMTITSKDDMNVKFKTRLVLPKEESKQRHSIGIDSRLEAKGFSILSILELSSKEF